MPSADRESSRDRELVLRHQHSMSDSGRSLIPMWDSSDPDRAPPPLPLNPGTSSPVTKPNTSATVAAAAEAFVARARESTYTTNSVPPKSEKSMLKGQYHKRMQSIQNGAVRDLSSYLENTRPPERSPERLTRTSFDFDNRSPEKGPVRSGTPTPNPRELGRETPTIRPVPRPAPVSIFTEPPPQSATMRALQAPPEKEAGAAYSGITNGSTALIRTPLTFDSISSQILSLTSIATNLQREMAQLSRRSKDNATDLISLKEATNARDEDIRKSLKDLVSNLALKLGDGDDGVQSANQYGRNNGSYFLDDKPHGLPKSVSLPRIASSSTFSPSMGREPVSTSNLFSVEGAAGIALLEKILREMGTKEGQERLLAALSEISAKSNSQGPDPAVAKRLEEIVNLLKEGSESRALIRTNHLGNLGDKPPQLELNFGPTGSMPMARVPHSRTPQTNPAPALETAGVRSLTGPAAAELASEDIMKLLKRLKDSVTEGGGMSAEIKALVRELRGEVLGMGREIGRKLDQAESTLKTSARGDVQAPGREEIALIVEEGLAELKEHMDRVMQEHHRESSSAMISRSAVDSQEIYNAVSDALKELPIPQQVAMQQPGSGIQREEILEAVREAWETYKPEIELQNFGLERDEILQCLQEGLEEYRPKAESKDLGGATYEEVLDAVKHGLENFKPPPAEIGLSITKDEILATVRECLDSYEFSAMKSLQTRNHELTREDVLDAVKEGLANQEPKELELNHEDLVDAVKAGLLEVPAPTDGVGGQVLDKMQYLIDDIKNEFRQYSAANGRDTEQVLDAMKDGLESLRAGIEIYVDRAADVTGKDEIIETVRDGLENLRIDLEGTIGNAPRPAPSTTSGELLDVMEKEFDHLRQTISSSMTRADSATAGGEELFDAIREGFNDLKENLPGSSPDSGLASTAAINEELRHLREILVTTMTRSNSDLNQEEILETIRTGFEHARSAAQEDSGRPESIFSNTGELLDAFNDGLDSLKGDIEKLLNKPQDMTVSYEILDVLKDGLADVRADIDRLHSLYREQQESPIGTHGGEVIIANPIMAEAAKGLDRTDFEKLEVMITQLKTKVDTLDSMPPPPSQPPVAQPDESTVDKADIGRLEELLRDVQAAITVFTARESSLPDNAATKDDTEAIETLLRNTKAKLDDIVLPDVESMVTREQINSFESIINNMRDAVDDLVERHENDIATKQDIVVTEVLLKELQVGIEELRAKSAGDSAGIANLEVLEALCTETKAHVHSLIPEGESLPTKTDLDVVAGLLREFQEKVDADAELTAQAFESRKLEHGGLADKVEDVKVFLDDVRVELKSKLDGTVEGIESLASTLETIGLAVTANDGFATLKELQALVAREFEHFHSNHDANKQEFEQHQATVMEKHDEHKKAVIEDLGAKIDARFEELMIKYDDAQLAADAKTMASDERTEKTTEAIASSRAIAEELKLLVDTLGPTVTESCERMSEDSRTVFNHLHELGAKMEDNMHTVITDSKADHQLTRADLSTVLVAVEGLQAQASEYNPKILSAIADVLDAVSQHFERSQKTTEEIKSSVDAIPSQLQLPSITGPPSPPLEKDLPPFGNYDDSEVHSKLDRLVEFTAHAVEPTEQMVLLEQIKGQVTAAAADFDAFVKTHQATMNEMQTSRSREAEDAAIALEKRTAQKSAVEADIVKLTDERVMLTTSVDELRQEEKDLRNHRSKLRADLSSLEMALQIRREEMRLMEARAESLERRILEGVLDHSRSLLLTARPKPSLKDMNLKRVPSTASNATIKTKAPSSVTRSAISSGVGLALKRRKPACSSPSTPNGDRRILSLSTIGVNKAAADKAMVLANPVLASTNAARNSAALTGTPKRSHSVKSNFPSRKTSWGGTKKLGMYADEAAEEDKENSILDEDDDEEDGSEGTERRTSFGEETDRRTSYSGSYSGTGSYGTGSVLDDDDNDDKEDDKEDDDEERTDYAPSTIGTVEQNEDDVEESDYESLPDSKDGSDEELETENADTEHYHGDIIGTRGDGSNKEVVLYHMPTDSGIGTEPPTAMEEGDEYFKDA